MTDMLPATSPLCTMAHVVAHAVGGFPATRAAVIAALEAASRTHHDAAASFGWAASPARAVALACGMACEGMAAALRGGGDLPAYLKPDEQAIAFGAAARALGLSHADRHAIASRGFNVPQPV